MRYTTAPSRRDELERVLAQEGYVSSADAARRFAVSEMTIRRDLQLLEVAGRVRRVAGGAATVATGSEPFERRDRVNTTGKRLLARAAAAEIAGCSTVALDAGTTVAALIPLVEAATVLTHSLPVITALAAHRPEALLAVGGSYQSDTRSFAGPLAEAAVRGVRTDAVVLSASSVTADALWSTNLLDAAMKRAYVARADRVVLVADGDKIGGRAPLQVDSIDAVHVLVTDGRADPDVVEQLVRRGVEVRFAR